MKYYITKYVEANTIEEAIKLDKKTPPEFIELIKDEYEPKKVGFGRF